MNPNHILVLFVLFLFVQLGCNSPQKPGSLGGFTIDNSDFQEITLLQDKRSTRELLELLSSSDPAKRFLAASTFGSNLDTTAISELTKLLTDPDEKVRDASAYALGQLKSEKVVQPILKVFANEPSRAAQSAMLEAIGKCGSKEELKLISSVESYRMADTLLLLGLVKSLYRFGLRKIHLPEGTKKMVDYLLTPSIPKEVKLYAGHYLQRTKGLKLKEHERALLNIYQKTTDVDLKMPLSVALGKTKGKESQALLKSSFGKEKDYRVRINQLKGLQEFDYLEVKNDFFKALDDPNINVRIQAASYFAGEKKPESGAQYIQAAKAHPNPRVKALLYDAALSGLSYQQTVTANYYSKMIKTEFAKVSNPYDKAALLKAIGSNPLEYEFVMEQIFNNSDTVIQTSGIEALVRMRKHADFNNFFFINDLSYFKGKFKSAFVDAVRSGNAALIGTAVGVFQDTTLNFKEDLESLVFIKAAMAKLTLPKDIELHNELQKTLDYLSGTVSKKGLKKPSYNHPIDWKLLDSYGDTIQAVIRTARGQIKLELYPLSAPGSVANFVALSKRGFYKGKVFHRVVPNFVAQAGCPRGDGWGSLNYTIRSELGSLNYDSEGWLGMASAGNDTECTQWFITHSATPHLDGRYTIFGKVTQGMDVVHKTEVGDKIQKIDIRS